MNTSNLRTEIHKGAMKTLKESYIGADSLTFEMVVDGASEGVCLDLTPLKNSYGKEFGGVEIDKGKIHISLCLPKFIKEYNIRPFSMTDVFMLKVIKNDIETALQRVIKGKIDNRPDVLSASAKAIECNITKQVTGQGSCSDVLNLINRSFTEGTNVVYQRASLKCKYDKETESLIIRKRNYYVLKSYNKTLEQRKKGNFDVENGLLRIETVMQDRTIQKLFGECSTIRAVLTEQGLMKIIREYKRIFLEDIIEEHILPCLRDVTEILYSSLTKTDSLTETIALRKELIMDGELLRKALFKWYKSKGYSRERAKRNTDTQICRCQVKYGFPKDAINTLREFKKICE